MNIVFFGDSITEGCFELVQNNSGEIDIIRDKFRCYVSLVKDRLQKQYPMVDFNIINAGISGNTSADGLKRLDSDVLSQEPDLVIVCFALNDLCLRDIENYKRNMEEIFRRISIKSKCIFMTPNMVNTYVDEETLDKLLITAEDCCACQNDGEMDALIEAGKTVAQKYNVTICDVYSVWKKLQEYGIDTTKLLCNHINHPNRNLHKLFADKLFNIIVRELEL